MFLLHKRGAENLCRWPASDTVVGPASSKQQLTAAAAVADADVDGLEKRHTRTHANDDTYSHTLRRRQALPATEQTCVRIRCFVWWSDLDPCPSSRRSVRAAEGNPNHFSKRFPPRRYMNEKMMMKKHKLVAVWQRPSRCKTFRVCLSATSCYLVAWLFTALDAVLAHLIRFEVLF